MLDLYTASRHGLKQVSQRQMTKAVFLHRYYYWPEKLPRTEAVWEDRNTEERALPLGNMNEFPSLLLASTMALISSQPPHIDFWPTT